MNKLMRVYFEMEGMVTDIFVNNFIFPDRVCVSLLCTIFSIAAFTYFWSPF